MKTLVENQKPARADEGFAGFDGDDTTAMPTDEEKSETESRTGEEEEMSEENDEESSSAMLSKTLKESEVQLVIDQVVDKLTPILQAVCVTDRIAKAERNAEEWRSMANLMMTNPHFATKKLSIGAQNEIMAIQRSSTALQKHPAEQTWDMFIQTPLATPIWTLIMKLDLHPTSSLFTRWWKKIRSDTRNDTWSKLSKYLQSIRYFNDDSDEFWRKYSVNPTYFSIQRLATQLVTQGNWLRASGIDLQKTIDKYFDAAEEIASSSGMVEDVDQILSTLWPANFRPHKLHYEGEPFAKATLFAQEDENLCDNRAQLKGFKFSPKNQTESPATATPTNTIGQQQPSQITPKATSTKYSTVSKLIEEILNTQK